MPSGAELERGLLRLRHAELAAGTAHDGPHHVMVGRGRVIQRAVVDRDRRELARDRGRPAAPPGEVGDIQRHRFRLRRQPLAPDPGGEGAEVAPVGGIGALARRRAAGFGGGPSVGS